MKNHTYHWFITQRVVERHNCRISDSNLSIIELCLSNFRSSSPYSAFKWQIVTNVCKFKVGGKVGFTGHYPPYKLEIKLFLTVKNFISVKISGKRLYKKEI